MCFISMYSIYLKEYTFGIYVPLHIKKHYFTHFCCLLIKLLKANSESLMRLVEPLYRSTRRSLLCGLCTEMLESQTVSCRWHRFYYYFDLIWDTHKHTLTNADREEVHEAHKVHPGSNRQIQTYRNIYQVQKLYADSGCLY